MAGIRNRRFSVLALLTFLIVCSCHDAPEFSEADRRQVLTECEMMMTDYFESVKLSGLKGEFDYLDQSDDFYWVPPGYESALSYDSVKTILVEMDGLFTLVDNQWISLDVNPLSHNLAAYTGKVRSNMTDTTGSQSEHIMLESGVLIKRKDGWKLLCGQSRMAGDE